MSGQTQGPPNVVCDVCGTREVAALRLMLGYVVCTPRDIPPVKLPPGAVRGNYHWKLEPTHDETIRIWCHRHALDEWLEFSTPSPPRKKAERAAHFPFGTASMTGTA